MLTVTEFFPVTTTLHIILWFEAIFYGGVALFEIFDDFHRKTPRWAFVNERLNTFISYRDLKHHKTHAAFCLMLAFVGLNGALEGKVTRFELEFIFLSLAIIVGTSLCYLPASPRFLIKILPFIPEITIQFVMYTLFSDLIRPEVIFACLVLNLWGIFVFTFRSVRNHNGHYSFQQLKTDMAEADEARNMTPSHNSEKKNVDEQEILRTPDITAN